MHLAQIVVTPVPDPNVRNLKNSKAQNETEAKQKIKDIERRLKERGEDFAMLAQNYSEDPQHGAQRRRHGLHSRIDAGEGQSRSCAAW